MTSNDTGTGPEQARLQERVGAWGEATFPDSTTRSIFLHARDELVLELGTAIDHVERTVREHPTERVDIGKVREEAADVFLLLLHLAHRYGFDLHEAAEEKFATVQARTYTTDSGRGYVRHDEVTA